jgi:hypothetical protein
MHVKHLQKGAPIKVEFEGRMYEILLDADGAYVPHRLGEHMIALGLVARDSDDNPRPRWELLPGGAHGKQLEMFEPWVKRIS